MNSFPTCRDRRGARRQLGTPGALLVLGLWPHDLHAQAFIASRAHPEFGIGPTAEGVVYGRPTRNPWNLDHVAGGSSSGSAAAVAAGLGLLRLTVNVSFASIATSPTASMRRRCRRRWSP